MTSEWNIGVEHRSDIRATLGVAVSVPERGDTGATPERHRSGTSERRDRSDAGVTPECLVFDTAPTPETPQY